MNDPELNLPDPLASLIDFGSLEQEFAEDGGPDRIEKRLKAALEAYPEHGVPQASWAWYLSKHEDFVGAMSWLTRAIEQGPDAFRVQWRTRRASFRFRIGDWRAGFQEFCAVIAEEPDEALPILARSFEMRLMGDHVSGDLDEKVAMFLMGRVGIESLFAYFRQHGSFSSPENLEATFFVLTDPLDAAARIHRGEIFATMGAPTAAYYDLHLASVLKPKDLGLLARLEDLRMKGILADPPPYEMHKPAIVLMPIYDRILNDYVRFLESVVIPPRRGVGIGWVEKLFGRASEENAFDLTTTSRNLVIAGMAMGLAAIGLIAAFAIGADRIDKNKAAIFGSDFAWAPAVLWGVEGVVLAFVTVVGLSGSLIATAGIIQLGCRCRIAEMTNVLLTKRWYLRPVILYAFILMTVAVILMTIFVNLLIFAFLIETIQAAAAHLRTIVE